MGGLCSVLLIAVGPLGAQESTTSESVLSAQVGLGVNASSLIWTLGGVRSPRSELTYQDLLSMELAVVGSYRQPIVGNWSSALAFEIRGGPLLGGTAQDSDFTFEDRTEYSRSVSEITGDNSMRLDVGFALLHELENVPLVQLVEVWGGVCRSQLRLRKQNGRQVIPDDAPLGLLEDLDSGYRAQWNGPWYGGALVVPTGVGELRLMLKRHFRTRYLAEGQWNLREDLMQPKSFSQGALGSGYDLLASFRGTILPGIDVVIATESSSRQARNGYDIEYRVTGEATRGNLGEVYSSYFSFRVFASIQR
jgi:hypothetical protein